MANVMVRSLTGFRDVPMRISSGFQHKCLTFCVLTNHNTFDPIQKRYRGYQRLPRINYKPWQAKKNVKFFDDSVTSTNKSFLKEFIEDKYQDSPLKNEPWPSESWTHESVRAGVIARKIGITPQWLRNGKRVLATVVQVLDNHVINYIPPEKFKDTVPGKKFSGLKGALVIGANAGNPLNFTKAYSSLFEESGVMPKKKLSRFVITDNAKLQPGTPLSASHFRAGQYVDVVGKTIGHGFQGVVKRWGMKGGPASHGHTKNHRRMGSIGGGAGKAHIMKGKHMPGRMGQDIRILRGLKVLRINYKYNVMWILGPAIPGHVHHYVKIFDTSFLKHKKNLVADSLPFPTQPADLEMEEEEAYSDDMFPMNDPTITYEKEEASSGKKK